MDNDYRPPHIRNTTILLVLVGALSIVLGYQSFLWSITSLNLLLAIVGIFMLFFGFLTLCISFAVWLQKPWVSKAIAGIGLVFVVTLVILRLFLIAVIVFAPLYYIAIKWVRTSQSIESPDWAPDWNED